MDSSTPTPTTNTEITTTTLFVPIVSPPTPAPSPGPPSSLPDDLIPLNINLTSLSQRHRRIMLARILGQCSPEDLAFVSSTVGQMLKRDFLRDLPPELSLYILSFIDDPSTLVAAASVSSHWYALAGDDTLWSRLCSVHGFNPSQDWASPHSSTVTSNSNTHAHVPPGFSFRAHFKREFQTVNNWRSGGSLLRTHRVPFLQPSVPAFANDTDAHNNFPVPIPSSAIPTSLALDSDWVVVGLANSKIHIFSARSGVLTRTLIGHSSGVWAISLIKGSPTPDHPAIDLTDSTQAINMSRELSSSSSSSESHDTGRRLNRSLRNALGLGLPPLPQTGDSDLPSDPAGSSLGWGQPNPLVVSGGCDKDLRVWDVRSGYCVYVLRGHTSTIRCLKILHRRPIAVSGSRDCTVRVWDVQRGKMLRVLNGHESSVRCLDVWGNKAVTGSYDTTCRVWDVDTGQCVHVLRGHFHQVYSVAFDGSRIASGGIDTTVRLWDAESGVCLALLQGHTALVCLLQLSPTMLVTGGSDGRVITFSLDPFPPATSSTNVTNSSTPALTPTTPTSTNTAIPPPPTLTLAPAHVPAHVPPLPLTTTATTTAPTTTPLTSPFSVIQKLAAHDSSVSSLQLSSRFLVTSGNDGRVRLFELQPEEDRGDRYYSGYNYGNGYRQQHQQQQGGEGQQRVGWSSLFRPQQQHERHHHRYHQASYVPPAPIPGDINVSASTTTLPSNTTTNPTPSTSTSHTTLHSPPHPHHHPSYHGNQPPPPSPLPLRGRKCEYIRELTEPCESVWKVAYTRTTCAIVARRAGRTVLEVWRFGDGE